MLLKIFFLWMLSEDGSDLDLRRFFAAFSGLNHALVAIVEIALQVGLAAS